MLQFFASPTAYQPISSLPTTATSSVRSLQTTRCRPTCRRTLDGWTPSGGEMGKLVEAGEPRFPHLSRLMTTLLVLPAGNASSKIVCSQVRKIATNFRSELGRDTLFLRRPSMSYFELETDGLYCALLSVKCNVDDSATSFTCSAKLVRSAKSATYRYNQGH